MSKTLIYKTRWRFLPILNYLLIASFSILCTGSLFVNSSAFTDNQIFPKWLFVFIGLGVIGLVFQLCYWLGKICLQYENAKCNDSHIMCSSGWIWNLAILQYLTPFLCHIQSNRQFRQSRRICRKFVCRTTFHGLFLT